jgi:hypothetical protein
MQDNDEDDRDKDPDDSANDVEEDNREYNNAGDSDKCYDKAKNS